MKKIKFLLAVLITIMTLISGFEIKKEEVSAQEPVQRTLGETITMLDGFVGETAGWKVSCGECVGLVQEFYLWFGLGEEGVSRVNDAKCLNTGALPAGFTVLQGVDPQPGDIVFYTSGDHGHVIIVGYNDTIYEQNYNYHRYVEHRSGFNTQKIKSYCNGTYWGVIRPTYYAYLDLNSNLNGEVKNSGDKSFYTVDIYINDVKVADDVCDYYTKWPVGTKYEIKDIHYDSNNYFYQGVASGSLKGEIGYNGTNVVLKCSKLVYLDVNMDFDGTRYNGGDSKRCTYDVWIDGKRVANDVCDYYAKWPVGTKYEVTDIRVKNGTKYDGITSDSCTTHGTVKSYTTNVILKCHTGVVSGRVYSIQSAVSSNMMLDVNGASYWSGANIQIWSRNSSNAQKFIIYQIGNGNSYMIVPLCSYKALDVSGGSYRSGANVQQYWRNWSNAQIWRFEYAGDGYYYIKSALGNYLDVNGGKAKSGTNVQVWTFNGSKAQKWKLIQQ